MLVSIFGLVVIWQNNHGHPQLFKKLIFLFTLLRRHTTTVLRHSWHSVLSHFFCLWFQHQSLRIDSLLLIEKVQGKTGSNFVQSFSISSQKSQQYSNEQHHLVLFPHVFFVAPFEGVATCFHQLCQSDASSVCSRHPGSGDLGYLGLELEASQGEVGMG